MLFFSSIFTKGIKAKLNELESESEIFPQNEGKVGKSELTPVEKALTNCSILCQVAVGGQCLVQSLLVCKLPFMSFFMVCNVISYYTDLFVMQCNNKDYSLLVHYIHLLWMGHWLREDDAYNVCGTGGSTLSTNTWQLASIIIWMRRMRALVYGSSQHRAL